MKKAKRHGRGPIKISAIEAELQGLMRTGRSQTPPAAGKRKLVSGQASSGGGKKK